MRMFPNRYEDPRIGIGDWYAANLVDPTITEPEERLDIVNGKVRIRQLPSDATSTSDELVTVNMTTGNQEHRPANALPDNCEWQMHANPNPNHVYTCVGTSDADCPDEEEFVGIGTAAPFYKLDVAHTEASTGSLGGIRVKYWGSGTDANTGVTAEVFPENTTDMAHATGVLGTVNDLSYSGEGVQGVVNLDYEGADDDQGQVIGVHGMLNANAGYFGYGYGVRGNIDNQGTNFDRAYGTHGRVTGDGTMGITYGMFGETVPDGTVSQNFGGFAHASWLDNATISQSYGLRARSAPWSTSSTTTVGTSWGVQAVGRSGSGTTFGVDASAQSTGTTCYGVKSTATGASTNIGVHSQVADTSTNNWAGYFVGKVRITGNGYVSGNVLINSDESLKTNIEDLEDPIGLLEPLEPKTYLFNREDHPTLNLPEGDQIGLLAPNVEQVLPQLVSTVHDPAELDSLGAVVHPAEETKAVNYIGLIPVLIGAVKEQQAMIVALQQDLEEVRADLGQCCHNQGMAERAGNSASTHVLLETDLRIIPNPVADRTELRYTVAMEGAVRLEISDANGRMIQVQDEGTRSTGTFTCGWDTTSLAAGTYFCTLYVNDEPLVKKAVKLNMR